jgi:hypothetical protein
MSTNAILQAGAKLFTVAQTPNPSFKRTSTGKPVSAA